MSREGQRLDHGGAGGAGGGSGGVGIGVLSLDLLGQVLDRLREPRDRKACRLVSRAFERAEAAHRRALRALRREPLPRLLRAFPALERLDLSACASLDDASLAAAVAGADLGIRSVCLARASGVGWRGLDALVAACRRLEAVDLSHCVGAGDREAAALAAAAGLRELRLDKCLGVTDMGLAKVAVGCPRLEKLSVKWCREISDIGVDLLAKKCRELRSLDISYLKSVDVSRCDHVTSQGLASLIDGHNFLKKLNAADCLHNSVFFPSWLSIVVQALVFSILVCPLALMYVLGLYISAGISLWRLIEHDYGEASGDSNLKPALNVLYSLAVAQGVLFAYRLGYAFRARKGIAKRVADLYELDLNLVLVYLDETVKGCEKDPSFSRGRNLVTYGINLMMESRSHDSYLDGVKILGGLLLQYSYFSGRMTLANQLLTGSALFVHVISKLLEMMGPRSPYSTEIREKAARIVVVVAGSIRLEQFPGGIQCISSLFDTPEEYSWQPDGYERNSYLPKDYERYWLLKEYEMNRWIYNSTVELTSPGSDDNNNSLQGYKTRVIQGLCILQGLAVDEDNCRVISNTEGQLWRTMEPLTSDELHRNHHKEWWSMAKESLELMNRLMATPGETGTKLRREISSNNKVISTLKIIVECSKCGVTLKRQAVQIILDPFVDTSSIIAGGSSRIIFIWILLDIVLLTDYCFRKTFGSTHWANKSNDIRRLAREKLQAMLSLESEGSSAMSILQLVHVVLKDLTRTLVEARNNANRLQAAQFLKLLCNYYTKDDEYLKELKKAMVDVMPQVLSEILGYGSTRKEIPAATETGSVQFSAPGTDLESGVASHGNGQGNISSSHQQNREQQRALIELCEAIWFKWIDEDLDTTHQLNEIAARICSEQEKPVKNFRGLILMASGGGSS